MYPHVFPTHWIKGFWYNVFHPPLFSGIDENWDWGKSCSLKRLGEGHMRGRFSKGGRDPRGHLVL